MAFRNYSNTAVSTTLNGSITNSGTNVVLSSQTGMPTTPFLLSIEPDTANEEIVLVNSGAGTGGSPYVVVRGQDGTAAVSHASLVTVQHRVAAVDFQDSRNHEASGTAVHGLTTGMSVAGAIDSIVSNIVYSNSTTETTISKSFQIPGNSLNAGSVYRITVFGTLASTSTPTLTFKMKYGSVVLSSYALTFLSAASSDFFYQGTFVAQSVGGSGSLAGNGFLIAQGVNTTYASALGNDTQGLITATSTTSNQNFLVTATWSGTGTPSASDVVTTLGSYVEQVVSG